jgi:hypothetical protein
VASKSDAGPPFPFDCRIYVCTLRRYISKRHDRLFECIVIGLLTIWMSMQGLAIATGCMRLLRTNIELHHKTTVAMQEGIGWRT